MTPVVVEKVGVNENALPLHFGEAIIDALLVIVGTVPPVKLTVTGKVNGGLRHPSKEGVTV